MKPIALGLLALFALTASSTAFANCPAHVVKTTDKTTVATTDGGSPPATVPTSRDGG